MPRAHLWYWTDKSKKVSMDEQQLTQYRAHVRGAATFILLGRHDDAPMNAAKLMELYPVDFETVTADIDAIVSSERHRAGGVFELVPAPTVT